MRALKNEYIDQEKFLRWLRTDKKFREEVVHIIVEESDIVTKTYLDIQLAKLAKSFDKKLENMSQKFDRKLKKMTKEFDKKLNETTQILTTSFEDRINGLGGRWGKDNEYALRIGMKSILEEEFNARVRHWHYNKKILAIHPRREEYELDLVITDGKLILIEIKGSVFAEQVEAFADNIAAYEYTHKRKATRRLIITPYADSEAKKLAEKLNIEIMSPPLKYYREQISDFYGTIT